MGTAGAVVGRIANGGALDVFLVDRQLRCLTGRQVVERRVQVVQANLPNIAELAQDLRLDTRRSNQGRQDVNGWNLIEIHLPSHQRRGGSLSIRDDVPDHLVEHHPLATGNARGRFAARHVIGVALVHHAATGAVLGFDELERARANVLGDLGVGVGGGNLGLHHHAQGRAGLGQRIDQQAIGLLEHDAEGLGVHHRGVGHALEQMLASAVLGLPAPDGRHAVTGGDVGAVVPFQARAQLKGVGLAVG